MPSDFTLYCFLNCFLFLKSQKVYLDGTNHREKIYIEVVKWAITGWCLSTVKFCSKLNFPWTKFNPSQFIQRESQVSLISMRGKVHAYLQMRRKNWCSEVKHDGTIGGSPSSKTFSICAKDYRLAIKNVLIRNKLNHYKKWPSSLACYFCCHVEPRFFAVSPLKTHY